MYTYHPVAHAHAESQKLRTKHDHCNPDLDHQQLRTEHDQCNPDVNQIAVITLHVLRRACLFDRAEFQIAVYSSLCFHIFMANTAYTC